MEIALDMQASYLKYSVEYIRNSGNPKNVRQYLAGKTPFAFFLGNKSSFLTADDPKNPGGSTPPAKEDEPQTPEEIPPFRDDTPETPQEIPPYRKEDPNTPREIPPYKKDIPEREVPPAREDPSLPNGGEKKFT